MKKYTVFIDDMPSKHFDNPIEAEDYTRTLPKNTDFTVWDNVNECEYSFYQDSMIFESTKQIGDITRQLVIYRYNYKIKAIATDTCKNWEEPKVSSRNFMLTKTFPKYIQLVEKAKKHFGFVEN